MKTLGLVIAAGTLLVATQANAGSFPVNSGLSEATGNLIDQVAVQVYVHDGQRYCFYFNGWHGAGWYRCGFAFRRGLGWGGGYGWNQWSYGPYERRFGARHHEERMGVESGSRRTTTGVETRTRSTTGSGVESGTRMRGGTTGSAPNADVKSGGGAKMQGGPTGEGAGARGKGGTGGSPAGEGSQKQQ